MGAAFSTDDILTIAEGLRDGKTATQIAALLPERTRGSIAGIVFRHPDLKKIGFKRPEPKAFYQTTQKRRALVSKQKGMPPGSALLAEPVRLTELQSHHCKFPLWEHSEKPGPDGLFCAEVRTEDSSYCLFHQRLCRSIPKGRVA